MKAGLVDTLTTVAAQLVSACAKVLEEDHQLRLRIAAHRRTLDHARDAPVPAAEILRSRIPATVQEASGHFLSQYGRQIVQGLGDPNLVGSIRLPWDMDNPPSWAFLCASVPDLATTMLTRIVEQVPFEPSVPSTERPAHVQRLESELLALEQAEERLVDQARAAGVSIDHRPEVVTRRAQEARQAQREQALEDERRRRQALATR
ncbi:MAG: hypothetical protein ABJA98_19250 [Acidobacteriota bacterium]